MRFYVYITASIAGSLYVGVTSNLVRRMYEHRCRTRQLSFTSRYRVVKLVHFEATDSIISAIAREKEIKGWRRERKVALIEHANAPWCDLAAGWFHDGE